MMQAPLSRPAVLDASLVRPFEQPRWVGDGAEPPPARCGEPAQGGFVGGGCGGGHGCRLGSPVLGTFFEVVLAF